MGRAVSVDAVLVATPRLLLEIKRQRLGCVHARASLNEPGVVRFDLNRSLDPFPEPCFR